MDGDIDFLYSSSNFLNTDDRIGFHFVTMSNYYGYMRNNHPLANHSVLHSNDFNHLSVIPTVRRNQHFSVLRLENDILHDSNGVKFIRDNETIDKLMLSVLTGNHVAILPYPRSDLAEHIRCIPFDGKYQFQSGVFYLKKNKKALYLI